jgi:hypothetical protein
VPLGLIGTDYTGEAEASFVEINPDVRAKFDAVNAALDAAGFAVVHEEWETRHYDYLNGDANAIVEIGAPRARGGQGVFFDPLSICLPPSIRL